MCNKGVLAGSYDPAIPNITGINTGIYARNIRSDMCMSMEGKDMDGKSRKFYNIVSHRKCLLDKRIGELK